MNFFTSILQQFSEEELFLDKSTTLFETCCSGNISEIVHESCNRDGLSFDSIVVFLDFSKESTKNAVNSLQSLNFTDFVALEKLYLLVFVAEDAVSIVEKEIRDVCGRFESITLNFIRCCQKSFKDQRIHGIIELCLQTKAEIFLLQLQPNTEMKLRNEITHIANAMQSNGLSVASDGDVSVRLNKFEMLIQPNITPQGSSFSPSHFVKVNYELNTVESNKSIPSAEYLVHTLIYQRRQDVNAVVHIHSPSAVVCSTLRLDIPCFHYQIVTLLGSQLYSILCTGFEVVGSQALAYEVVSSLGDQKACLLGNHGGVAVGSTLQEAFDNAILLEKMCEYYLRSLSTSYSQPVTLTKSQVEETRTKLRAYHRCALSQDCSQGDFSSHPPPSLDHCYGGKKRRESSLQKFDHFYNKI